MGKYEVLGKLAETPTTELFVARTANAAPPRFVVLKRLRRDVARDLARVKAFLDRAKLVSNIEHPNVAQVHDFGKLGGSYYAALELVDGETLASMIEHARASKIPMPVRVVLTLAAGAAAGLHHAHERRTPDGKLLGIVHGNLSPTSVMVTRDGTVKLVGFARIPETRDVAFSAPELRDGRPIDRRADLYSLGLVLWELLTLEPLPRDDSAAPAPPSSKRYEIPKDLDAIVEKLLAKNPDDRYATAGDLLAALEALAAKLELALTTNDLARVMRLWYGEPAPGDTDDVKSMPVEADAVPPDLVAPASPIDAMLDDVRVNAAAIRRLVAATSAPPTTRRQRTTQVPLGDAGAGDQRESFEQIRDRILANARPKRDTSKPENDNGEEPTRKKPETLNPTNQYSYITNVKGKAAEPLRVVTGTTPPTGLPTDATNVAVAKVPLAKMELKIEEKNRATDPDKVIVDLPAETTRAKTATGSDLEAETKPLPLVAKPEPEPEPEPEKPAAKPEPARAKSESGSAEPSESPEPSEKTETTEKVARPSKPAAAANVADDEPSDAPPPARAPWLVPVLAAAVAVAAIAIVLVLHGGTHHTVAAPSPPPHPVHADAGVKVATVVADAPAIATAVPDAAPVVAPPDAAVAAVPVDAPQVAAAPPDAVPAVPVVHVDAAVVANVAPDAAEHHHHHEPPPPDEPKGEPKPPKPPKDERTIEQLFDAGEYDKASSGCTSTTQFNTPRLIDCALAACHVKDTALAKRWSRAIGGADRATVATQCHDLGVDLDVP